MTSHLGPRVRERKPILRVNPSLTLGTQTVGVNGGGQPSVSTYKVNSFGTDQNDYIVLEKCWDELHSREKVIQYYLKRKCHRRVYLTREEAEAYKLAAKRAGHLHPPDLYMRLAPGKVFQSGGPFTLIRTSRADEFTVKSGRRKGVPIRYSSSSGIYYATYLGGFLPTSFGPNAPSSVDLWYGYLNRIAVPTAEHSGLESLGAKAWNSARPKTSSSDVLTFLGELRELPSMLRTTAKGFYDVYRARGGSKRDLLMSNNVADHFLNHNFGWAPFVGDLIDFYETYQHLDQRVKQMLRDNGQWIKRRIRVEESATQKNVVVSAQSMPSVYPTLHDWLYSPRGGKYGTTTWFEENYVETWFSGRFKYYIPRPPDNPDTRNYNRVLDTLRQYGVRVSPAVIWNLTPWSWLTDWFGNLGHIIDNVDAQNSDNLTAKYAYIMRHSRTRYVNDSTVYTVNGDERMTWARELESKVRIEASPFGFGLTGGGVNTPYRAAILAALGLTRRG